MKDLFIPYEEALELKKLEFNEPCFAFYNGKFIQSTEYDFDSCNIKDIGECVQAPIYQQAFKFFREKFNMNVQIRNNDKHYFIVVNKIDYFSKIGESFEILNSYKSYEKAELEAIKECIKIVKNEQNSK